MGSLCLCKEPIRLSVEVMSTISLECSIHTIVTLKRTSRLWNEVLDYKLIYKKILDHTHFFVDKPFGLSYKRYFSFVRDQFFHTDHAIFLYHCARKEDVLDRFKTYCEEKDLDLRYTQWINLPPLDKLNRVPHLKDEILRYHRKCEECTLSKILTMRYFVEYYGDFWLKNVRYADYSSVYYRDYVDYIDWDSFKSGEHVFRGLANGDRPFFSLRFVDDLSKKTYVVTCFQRLTQKKVKVKGYEVTSITGNRIYFGKSHRDLNITPGCISLHCNPRELLLFKMLLTFGEAHLVINGKPVHLRRYMGFKTHMGDNNESI